MIFVGLLLLIFGVYTLFLSSDTLDMAISCLRVVTAFFVIVCDRFVDPMVYECAVLIFAVFHLVLLGFMRMEVQVDHDRN